MLLNQKTEVQDFWSLYIFGMTLIWPSAWIWAPGFCNMGVSPSRPCKQVSSDLGAVWCCRGDGSRALLAFQACFGDPVVNYTVVLEGEEMALQDDSTNKTRKASSAEPKWFFDVSNQTFWCNQQFLMKGH